MDWIDYALEEEKSRERKKAEAKRGGVKKQQNPVPVAPVETLPDVPDLSHNHIDWIPVDEQ